MMDLPEWSDWTGETIYALREALNLSRRELAEAVGVSERSLYRWENGLVAPRPVGLRAIREYASTRLQEPTARAEFVDYVSR